MVSQEDTLEKIDQDPVIKQAKNLFRFLAEVKKLSSPSIKDYENYDQVIWISEIPREKECYTKAWGLIGQPAEIEKDSWIEIQKPELSSPPELPDGLDVFVSSEEWRDSSCETPSLLKVSRELLIRHFLPDEDGDPQFENISINENDEVFEAYIQYVDQQWQPWAKAQLTSEDPIPFPEPLEIIIPWLDPERLRDFTLEEPPLMEEISIEVDTKFQEAKEQLEANFKEYLDKKWYPWAEKDRRQQRTQKIYNQLYSVYQRRQKLGEQYELIIAFGALYWKGPNSGSIRRHVLTAEAAINFNARRGIITVEAPPNGCVILIEDDMLHNEERPQPTEKARIDQQAKDITGDFWDQAVLTDLLKSFVNTLQYSDGVGLKNDGQFDLNLEKPQHVLPRPQINLAPAIVLRKRSQRGFIRLLEEIEKNIEETGKVPNGVKKILSIPSTLDDKPGHGDDKHPSTAFSTQEVYFPLPANKEQIKIVNYLNKGEGVRVQGPPGTGKSHTITNLVCHLLATGHRILVTSETERALRSLRSKFTGAAEPLSELAVILLGNDTTSLRELEKSVQAINAKREYWNEADSKATILNFENQLSESRKKRRIAENDLKALRELDVFKHNNKFGRYSGTLQEIAQQIADEKEKYRWLEDDVSETLDIDNVIKLDTENFVRKWHEWDLASLINQAPTIIDINRLPSQESIENAISALNQLEKKIEELGSRYDQDLHEKIKDIEAQKISELYKSFDPILSGLRTLNQHVYRWAYAAGKQIVAEQDRVWKELYRFTKEKLDTCSKLIDEISAIEVNGVQDNQVRKLQGFVEIVLRYANEGKKIKKGLLYPKEYNDALKSIEGILVDGHPINSIERLELIKSWLIVADSFKSIADHWKNYDDRPSASFSIQMAHYQDLLEPLDLAIGLHHKVQHAQVLVDSLSKFSAPVWHDVNDLENFSLTFNFLILNKHREKLTEEIKGYVDLIRFENVTNNDFFNGLEKAIYSHDIEAYRRIMRDLSKENDLRLNQLEILSSARHFRSLFPATFSKFMQSNNPELWIDYLTNLPEAVSWSQASTWIQELCDPRATQKLNVIIESHYRKERELIGLIAQEKAWAYCISRLGEYQRQALIAWLQAIEAIGKGTGKYAERNRRVARKKLVECQSAIPAWVMPLHRVVETVHPLPEIFDVAIIDEASQSGSEAMILNYISKKVIVVGDDKQIRPQNIGVNYNDVEYLRNRYLADFPHSETFSAKSSYFSQAEVRFPEQVSLREHFRCMPEIIQFSNNYFYQSAPLIPLKQFGNERLEPVFHEYVEDGYRVGTSGNAYNEPEAERLVERLAECCSDPLYDRKTFGVIALHGHRQAALIEELLLNEIDPQEYEDRKILVGSAYAFQGDERDIIFISMVNAPQDGNMCRAVTSPEREREFNVAASRAREQMILFHSATLNDLRDSCLQHKLLTHCLDPSISSLLVADMSIPELREKAYGMDRILGNQPTPFESWFEVDVFLKIVDRGYQVIPQYAVNQYDKTYRIDMIVVGLSGKLAVECDGDHWHGPAQYEKDMVRQRDLERCNWEFWRVRGGAFYRDPDSAMESLWGLLDKRGIYPEGRRPQEKLNLHQDLTVESADKKNQELLQEEDYVEFSFESKDENSKESLLYPNGDKIDNDAEEPEFEKRNKKGLTPADIQDAILTVLSSRPNNSIAIKSLTKEVLKHHGIITRGNPRKGLENRVMRSLGVLKRQNKVREYKAKNARVRLTATH